MENKIEFTATAEIVSSARLLYDTQPLLQSLLPPDVPRDDLLKSIRRIGQLKIDTKYQIKQDSLAHVALACVRGTNAAIDRLFYEDMMEQKPNKYRGKL